MASRVTTTESARTTPHDPAAESAVLGSLLITPALIRDVVRHGLTERSFHYTRNRIVWNAVLSLGNATDLVTVLEHIRRRGNADPDLATYIASLTDLAGLPDAIGPRCELLLRLERQRELIATSRDLAAAAHDADDPIAAASDFAQRLRGISAAGASRRGLLDAIGRSLALTPEDAPRPESFLGDGLICGGDLVLLAGQPGLGKSRLALELGRAMASRERWMGLTTGERPLRVGYLALEFSNYRWLERCLQIFGDGTVHREPQDLIAAYSDIPMHAEGGGFWWATRQQLDGGLDLVATAGVSALRHTIEALSLDIIFGDALSRCMGNRDETNETFGDMVERLDDVRYATGCAIVFVHHEKKVDDRSKTDRLSMVRGGSKLTAAANTVITVSKSTSGLRCIYFDKANYAREPDPIHYEIPEIGGPTVMLQAPEKRGDKNIEAVWAALRAKRDGITAEEIAAAVGMSPRSVRRHLERLRERGAAPVKLDFRTWSWRIEEEETA